VGDRLMPVPFGLPIEEDPETFEGVEAVVVSGSGLIIDVLTGAAFGSDELWMRHVVSIWKSWLLKNAPQPPVAPVHPLQKALEGAVIGL
jgi:hypothetical protein